MPQKSELRRSKRPEGSGTHAFLYHASGKLKMQTKEQILDRMALYRIEGGGIGSWLTEATRNDVFERLGTLDSQPLPAVQLNQLLVLAHEAPVSDGFFQYYWLDVPNLHPYSVRELPGFRSAFREQRAIQSLDHLAWGLHRLYVDGLLYFGNVRTAFRALRELSHADLQEFFSAKRIDTDAIKRRGPPLPLRPIERDSRYLISEIACKTYGENPQITSDLHIALTEAYEAHAAAGGEKITVKELLDSGLSRDLPASRENLSFSASHILNEMVLSKADVDRHYQSVADKFEEARRSALENTRYYLSMLTDLDVYVATSMRTRDHFLKMADICDAVFNDGRLKPMNLRYFDPTLSAAGGHEDKGLIECLMVKCAKALVYCGGEKESYGKDAEAAMALSLGRPVIFFCEQRAKFYREVHPLTRLVQFDTGIAVGAMVTDKLDEMVELLCRTFENRMIYSLERSKSGSLRLLEDLTGSVVRIQTNDALLTETFWNHYHQDRSKRSARVVVANEPSTHKLWREAGTRRTQEQANLQLDDTSNLIPLAARNARSLNQERAAPVEELSANPAKTWKGAFPLSREEVFDGISSIKRNTSSGTKRYTVFSGWLDVEQLDVSEGVKLLRFVELTLENNGMGQSSVYKLADLTRWYQQMYAGEPFGSKK